MAATTPTFSYTSARPSLISTASNFRGLRWDQEQRPVAHRSQRSLATPRPGDCPAGAHNRYGQEPCNWTGGRRARVRRREIHQASRGPQKVLSTNAGAGCALLLEQSKADGKILPLTFYNKEVLAVTIDYLKGLGDHKVAQGQ